MAQSAIIYVMKDFIYKVVLAMLVIGIASSFAVTDAVLLFTQSPQVATSVPPQPDLPLNPSNPSVNTATIDEMAVAASLELTNTNDIMLLHNIIADDAEVFTRTILYNNDRIGTIAWVDHPQVREYFLALKEALFKNFSTNVQDLQDRSIRLSNQTEAYNELRFIDPAISTNKLIFGRIQNRLFEIRIDPNQLATIEPFITAISGQ